MELLGENTLEVRGQRFWSLSGSLKSCGRVSCWRLARVTSEKSQPLRCCSGSEQFDEAVLFWQRLGSQLNKKKLSSAVVTFQCWRGHCRGVRVRTMSGGGEAIGCELGDECTDLSTLQWVEKHQCCLTQVPMVGISEPIRALPSTSVDSRPRRVMNPDGGGAAVCLFAVSPVQALTSSHPFLTYLYMFLILLGGQRSCYSESLPVRMQRDWWCKAVQSSEQLAQLAECWVAATIMKLSRRLRSPAADL